MLRLSSVAVLAVLTQFVAGCTDLSFDTACVDDPSGCAEVGTDGSVADTTIDTAIVDSTLDDAIPDSAIEIGSPDSSAPDTLPADTSTTDATTGDTSFTDATIADTAPADTAPADTAVADTSIADTFVADGSTADTAVPDTTAADSFVPDTSPTDSWSSDSAPADTATSTDAAEVGADTGLSPVGLFEQPHPWTQDISAATKSSESDTVLGAVSGAGGFGTGGLQLDFSFHVLRATSTTPFRTFTKGTDWYSPDCDDTSFPVPVGGAVQGSSDYNCPGWDIGNPDLCRLLVIDSAAKKLYEMFQANIDAGVFTGGCAVVWDLTRKYPDTLRGKGCVSAELSGMPITSTLASPDEAFAGEIKHALRFVLPTALVQNGTYVAPATHALTGGTADKLPIGARLRLKSSFDLTSLSAGGARVIGAALKKYGFFLQERGTSSLTVQSDRGTTHSWAESGVTASSLSALKISDFELMEMGARTNWFADATCYRTP